MPRSLGGRASELSSEMVLEREADRRHRDAVRESTVVQAEHTLDGVDALRGGRADDRRRRHRDVHRVVASFDAALLHLAGAPRDTFGLPDPALKDFDQTGPLSELLS